MMLTLYNTISQLNEFSDETTYRLSGKVEMDGGPRPIALSTMMAAGDAPVPAPMALTLWLGDKFNRLYLNNVNMPEVKTVNLSVDLVPERRVVTVENAWVPNPRSPAGRRVDGEGVAAAVARRTHAARSDHRRFRRGSRSGDHRILLSDADTLNRMQNTAGFMNRFLDLPQTVSLLNQERTNNRLYVSLVSASPTAYYDDKTMPSLPASVLNVMQAGRTSNRAGSDFARNGRRAGLRALRLPGHRQLLFESTREVARALTGLLFRNMKLLIPLLLPLALAASADQHLDAGRSPRTTTRLSSATFPCGATGGCRRRPPPASSSIPTAVTCGRWRAIRKATCGPGARGAKLYRIGTDGKGKLVADLDALEIHALAVDARDRVYAATSPDGRIYRIDGNSKPAVFYEPKAKYIWSMVFDHQGDLFVATGDQGEIHRVTPDGKGSVFYRTEETHVRSLAIDAKGNLIAGTDPGGLIIRVTPCRRRLRALPGRQARSDRGGGGARWGGVCGGGRHKARHAIARAGARPAAIKRSRAGPGGRGCGRARRSAAARSGAAAQYGSDRGRGRQRIVAHRSGRQSAQAVDPRAGCRLRDRVRP